MRLKTREFHAFIEKEDIAVYKATRESGWSLITTYRLPNAPIITGLATSQAAKPLLKRP